MVLSVCEKLVVGVITLLSPDTFANSVTDQKYFVPEGTADGGINEKAEPLQICGIVGLFATLGLGFTLTVTVKVELVQVPELAVTI